MSRYNVCRALRDAYLRFLEYEAGRARLELNEKQREALSILNDALRGKLRVPLGGVQGPPGTGKTSVVEEFARTGIANIFDPSSREIVLYIAPTNHLVVQAFERIASALLTRGYRVRDIVDMSRVYGYKVSISGCKKYLQEIERLSGGRERYLDRIDMRRLIGGYIDSSVRIVFATEFQRVSGRFLDAFDAVHLVVDEASKSPYFRSFIPIADHVLRRAEYASSLVVLGDPEQAITLPEAVKLGRIPLLMNKVLDLLHDSGLEDDNFVILDVTYRIPMPSEQPISRGFYRGILRGYETAIVRLERAGELIHDLWNKVSSFIRNNVAMDTELEKIMDSVYSAISTRRALVFYNVGRFHPATRAVTTYDPRRTKIAMQVAFVIQVFNHLARRTGSYELLTPSVIAPYSDLAANVSFNFKQRYGNLVEAPRAGTVQSFIGGEDESIIAVVGKEYPGRRRRAFPWLDDERFLTLYYQEPQVLNVQLSRHRRFMAVIGNLEALERSRINKISETASTIKSLVEDEYALLVDLGTG